MAKWYYDPTSPETIFASFMELEPGYSAWDKAEQNIYGMAFERAVSERSDDT